MLKYIFMLFLFGVKVDSHYILSHLAPEMSPIGSIKQVKESKIMEFFQDFLLELEGMDLKNVLCAMLFDNQV